MTDLEQLSVNVQRHIDAQNARIDGVLAKVDMLVVESQQQREDIRRLQDKQYEDRKALENKIDRLGDKIQNMVIAAVVGFGAIVFAAVSALK